jgi:hypothetical protein
MQDLIEKIESWARDRRIIPNSTPMAQLMKTVSELGERSRTTARASLTAWAT